MEYTFLSYKDEYQKTEETGHETSVEKDRNSNAYKCPSGWEFGRGDGNYCYAVSTNELK